MRRAGLRAAAAALAAAPARAALPPGPAPFAGAVIMQQPVPGAPRAATADGWRAGKLCDVSKTPYSARNNTNATGALRQAIDDCGDRPDGGTVLVPKGLTLLTASLWLRSNLTLRVEDGAALVSTATGKTGGAAALIDDAPLTYTRRNCVMVTAHAGFINAGRCLRMKDPQLGGDDCAEWTKLSNVVIEGGGTLDANGDAWYEDFGKKTNCDGVDGVEVFDDYVGSGSCSNLRPMMLDLFWVDGLTIRDMKIRRPGYWTVHPTFSNNVRVTGNSIITTGSNTDGCDPDSSWNVYIAENTFSTGDDCIAIKAGRDWSGRLVNISTQNVLAERNYFLKGHGVSIGSETSGWVRNITIRDSVLDGTNLAVRIKTMRGRGGGVEDVIYENLTGKVVSGIQLTLNYHKTDPTNASATPELRRITIRDVDVHADNSYLECDGLSDSEIDGIVFDNVTVTGSSKQTCSDCQISAERVSPEPSCAVTPPTPPPTPDPACEQDPSSCCVVEQQLSGSACTKGVSFGCWPGNHSMWTWHGCRGVFTCDGAKSVECNFNHHPESEFHVCNC